MEYHVLVSNLTGGNNIITNGYKGIQVCYNNNEKLKRSIDWFLQNPEKIKKIGKNQFVCRRGIIIISD